MEMLDKVAQYTQSKSEAAEFIDNKSESQSGPLRVWDKVRGVVDTGSLMS